MLKLARTYKKGFSTLPLSWTDRPTAQATNQHLRLHTVASGTTKKHSFIWHSFSWFHSVQYQPILFLPTKKKKMKFSTILSTFALASVSAAAAVDLNMGQEGSPIVARSPAGASSSRRPPKGPKGGSAVTFPDIGDISTDPSENQFYRTCMAGCRAHVVTTSGSRDVFKIDKSCKKVCLKSLEDAKKEGILARMMPNKNKQSTSS